MTTKCKTAYAWGANKSQMPINPLMNFNTHEHDAGLYWYYIKNNATPIRKIRPEFDKNKPEGKTHPMWGPIEKRNLFLTTDNVRSAHRLHSENSQVRRMKPVDLGMNIRGKNLPRRFGHITIKGNKIVKKERPEWHDPERLYGYRKDLNFKNDSYMHSRLPQRTRDHYCNRGACNIREFDQKYTKHIDIGARAPPADDYYMHNCNNQLNGGKINPYLRTKMPNSSIFQRTYEQDVLKNDCCRRPVITTAKKLNIDAVDRIIPKRPANQWMNNTYNNHRYPGTHVRKNPFIQRSFNEDREKPIERMLPSYNPIPKYKILNQVHDRRE